MGLIKQAMKQQNMEHAKSLVIKEAVFPKGFISFVDALVRDGVVKENYCRESGAIGFRWNDSREDGGLLIETEKFPVNGCTGTVIFEGSSTALELVIRQLKLYEVQYK